MPEADGGAAGAGQQGQQGTGTSTATAPQAPVAPTAEELQAQVDEWKGHARKHENDAKNRQKEIDTLKSKHQTEDEKAIDEAKKTGRREAALEMGSRMAATECRAALTGIVDDPADVVDDLDLSRYVKDDGEVDTAAVKALREKWEKITGRTSGGGQNGQQQQRVFQQGNTGSSQQTVSEDPIRVLAREQGITSR